MAVIKTPTQIREEQAKGLVSLLNDIKAKVDEDKVNLKSALIRLNGALERFYTPFDTQLTTAVKLKRFILQLEKKKCNSISSDPRCNVHDIAEDTKTLIDTVVAEVKALGLPVRNAINDKSVNINTTVTQSQEQKQNQQQNIVVKILLEAVKDELTGKQWKELLAVAKDNEDPEMTRKRILDKIKNFGEEVAANIVANIIVNPEVFQSLSTLI